MPAARTFLRGAKRVGSLIFPGLMFGFLAAETLYQLGDLGLMPLAWAGAWLGLGLVVLLIAAMGGRLVGAVASGAAQRSGGARIVRKRGLSAACSPCLPSGSPPRRSAGKECLQRCRSRRARCSSAFG